MITNNELLTFISKLAEENKKLDEKLRNCVDVKERRETMRYHGNLDKAIKALYGMVDFDSVN